MPWFHVCISHWTGKTTRSEVKLDLTQEELEGRVIENYRAGLPITINGKAIGTEDIERVKITRTDQDSRFLRPSAERISAASPFTTVGAVDYYIANSMGIDVSDEFITGPPGMQPSTLQSPTHKSDPPANARDVFVIHGRNAAARDALFDFLRSIDLHPIEWSEAIQATGKPSPYIGEILDAAFSRAHAVVALFTPDDEARLRAPYRVDDDPPHEAHLTGQARPNVLFEAGMAMGRNQDRTVLVEIGTLRPFSDVGGRHVIRMDGSSQRRQELAQRLQVAGCPANLSGTAWHSAGDFESAIAETRQEETEISNLRDQQPATTMSSEVSGDSGAMLVAAAGNNGFILRMSGDGRPAFKAGTAEFGEYTEPRSRERWEHAMDQLVQQGFMRGPIEGSRRFELTHLGYELADRIRESTHTEATG